METENALAVSAPAMPHDRDDSRDYNFNSQDLDGMTALPTEQHHMHSLPTQTPSRPSPVDNMHAAAWLDTPVHITDHGVPSNLRDSHGQQEPPPPQTTQSHSQADISHVNDPNSLLERKPSDAMTLGDNDDYDDNDNDDISTMLRDSQAQLSLGPDVPSTPSHMEATTAAASPEHTTEEAFAMLKFSDSHCYVRSTNLVIGRDMNFLAKYQQQKKEEKRKRARALQARRALDIYAREPSQPSLVGDDEPSGESLEGRPEPTGPLSVFSVFSEQGGPVAYNNPYSDDENDDNSRLRRRDRKNKSSSNTSVAPKSLMAFAEGENLQAENRYAADGTLTDPREWAQLPVHPPIPADIKKISREHLLFHYDSNRGRWLLDVIGNGAIFNGVSYMKDTIDLELNHNDEIFIATLGMRFMLPESVVNQESEPDDDEDEDDEMMNGIRGSSISPARRLSKLFSAEESSDDDDEPLAQVRAVAQPLPKIKLKFKKAAPKEDSAPEPLATGGKGKGKGKGKAVKSKEKAEKTEKPDKTDKPEKKSEKKPVKVEGKAKPKEEPATELPEGAKKTENIRKPSDAAREPVPNVAAGPGTEQSPPVIPHAIDPTSVLANLAPDQLPEKRKGPGRPPKNGLLSKRDESGVKRKTKEFERRGIPVPNLDALIAMVRQEQKAKDAANKAQARGEPIPDMPMPSIESSEMMHDGDRGRAQTPRENHAMESGSPGADRKTSPRLPRPIPREASPIKPMSEFTEEELKKPNMTYIYIIDEVLQNVEGGKADLQAIYDKIMKRWPFYKYKVGSLGWQSSVRHNLLSCDRFRDAGKSGKGKLWAINHEHPLDNKKRKPTPPPRPMQMPMQNGQMAHGVTNMGQNQFGQPHYNSQYPQSANGQQSYAGKPGSGPYYSPYGSSGNFPPPGPNGTHAVRQGSNGAYPANASQAPQPRSQSQQPPAPPNPFQPVVDAIMAYRKLWLGSLVAGTPEYTAREEAFNRGTDYFSNIFHSSGGATVSDAEIASVEPFMTLKGIFETHKALFAQAAKKPADATPGAGESSNRTADGQPTQNVPAVADSPSSGAPAPPATGSASAPNSAVPSTDAHPPPQTSEQTQPAGTNASSGTGQDTTMTGMTATADSAPLGAPIAASSVAPSAPLTTSSGQPASLSVPTSTIPVEGPPPTAANPVPPTSTTPANLDGFSSGASVAVDVPGAETQSIEELPAVPIAPAHSDAPASAPQPTSPLATAATQQPEVKPTENPVAQPTSSVEAPLPSAGTKRSVDDDESGTGGVDPKRPKLA